MPSIGLTRIPPRPVAMNPVETEVKFHVPDPPAVRAKLLSLGARSLGRSHEHNIRFENAVKDLRRGRNLLRLRRDRKSTLTYKCAPAQADPEFKELTELEVDVSDFDTMRRILAALGFHPEQVYEKWRETLVLDHTAVCLDELPFGNFLEIEGPKEQIRGVAARLALEWDRRILLNYIEIFEILRADQGLSFADVTFANFTGLALDLTPFLPRMEAGRPVRQPAA
jgi:adenylate cyclase, class 2